MDTRQARDLAPDTRWAAAIDCAQLGVWDADFARNTCFYSPSWKRMLGYADHELLSHPDLWLDFIHPDDRQRAIDSGSDHFDGQTPEIETEFRLRHRDGHWIWVLDRGQIIERDAAGQPTRMIGVQTDITMQKEAAARLSDLNQQLEEALDRERTRQLELVYLARHDGLTDLLNRNAFDDLLAAAVADESQRRSQALFYIDLDRFKVVNDTLGHAGGDLLLKLVAQAMVATLPATASIARLGGDEFAALVPVETDEDAYRLGCQLVQAVGRQQLQMNAMTHTVGASIGIVLLENAGPDALTALSIADAACYVSKSRGRNRVSLHDPATGGQGGRFAEVRAASELLDALDKDRLTLFGQEIRSLGPSGSAVKYIEVLARVLAPDGSLIMPGTFIPAAERFDLMGVLDKRVVQLSLDAISRPLAEADDAVGLAVNLSAMSLSDPDFWPFVEEELRRRNVSAKRICFEITETAAVNNFAEAERFVYNARKAGCRISLDDFGSGLSSFDYLRRFPVDCIKIDGAFVDDVATSPFDQAVCAAIGTIAAELRIEVVAERVADARSIDALTARGIGLGQGYFLHRPEPLADLLARSARPSIRTASAF